MDAEYQAAVLKVLREEGVVAVAHRFEVARFLSKLGTLHSDEEMLRFLAPHLNRADVLDLYAYFRQFRSETEWRAEFEGIFPAHTAALPRVERMPSARYIDSLKHPKIPGFQWQNPEDDGDRKMFRDILEHGCQVIAVEAGPESPDFAYSVGLYLNFLHPEILIMGVSSQSSHRAINQICREAGSGRTLREGDERSDLFEVARPVRFVAVPKERYFDYLGYATWFYRSLLYLVSPPMEHKFPVLQALWPDKSLAYPDNPQCDENVRKVQRLVAQPSKL